MKPFLAVVVVGTDLMNVGDGEETGGRRID